ncbi:DUF3019 domain-containing protein [Algibacillus agarilyticus]|uniref:DUF3019 domain-containing protein n=1 Tax=Algibacillus agarilyticus TaxID=2234133 RepID=UPI0013005745|nr:DUF3019 domain-containing protein [Algibacillus agarilyticus]
MSSFSVVAQKKPYIILKPKACALNNHAICSVDVLIHYYSPVAACLHVNEQSVNCIHTPVEHAFTYTYLGSEPLLVTLVDETGTIIYESELPVLQLAHYRRRQRNPWSLF